MAALIGCTTLEPDASTFAVAGAAIIGRAIIMTCGWVISAGDVTANLRIISGRKLTAGIVRIGTGGDCGALTVVTRIFRTNTSAAI